jgi:aldose 1-epimerase
MQRAGDMLSSHARLSCERIEVLDGGIERYRMQAGTTSLEVINLGCAITRLEMPDRAGRLANVVLGYPDIRGYIEGRDYFGVVVGRVANRIAEGRLRIGNMAVQLTRNHGRHHLHGGDVGFSRALWKVTPTCSTGSASVRFEFMSPAGDEGYPGNLSASVVYALQANGALRMKFEATSDAPTSVNMANHSYFNLRGEGSGDVLQHQLQIAADTFVEIDNELIPTGKLRHVAETPFDFRVPVEIGSRIAHNDPQIQRALGYDHCMMLQSQASSSHAVRPACTLTEAVSGRRLEILTDQPGIQIYSGNYLDGTVIGTSGSHYCRHAAVCLETQGLPDAPNNPDFPSVQLLPGERYEATTILRFDVLP